MIGKLKGFVDSVLNDALLLDVQNVGYIVNVPSYILHKVKLGDEVILYIEHLIRPEMMTLYGFLNLSEKQLFQKLMSVQGVGGKAASAILSVLTPDQAIEAIISQDLEAIKRADGVGPKVANRILTELKDYAHKNPAGVGVATSQQLQGSAYDDVLSTLIQLGYKRFEAQKALDSVAKANPELASAGELIPETLKRLSQKVL